MMKILNRKTLKVCQEFKGICIDLAGELELGRDDIYDFMHTTAAGSEKIGNYLYEKLKNYF